MPSLKTFLSLFVVAAMSSGPGLFAQASNLRVNNEKPEKGGQSKRIHPHGLKLILQGKKKEAISYLNKYKEDKVNPEQTQMLIDLALDKPDAWKFDAKTWPWKRTLARHFPEERRSVGQVHHRLRRRSRLRPPARADVGHHRSDRSAGSTPAWRQRLHRRPKDSGDAAFSLLPPPEPA